MGSLSSVSFFASPFAYLSISLQVQRKLIPKRLFICSLAEEFNLEQHYRKPFLDVWKEEKDHRVFGPLSERMGVRGPNGGELLVSDEEIEAASKYHCLSLSSFGERISEVSIKV